MSKINYCGSIYETDNKGFYKITSSIISKCPQSFYKYYALSSNSVNALTEMYIYATHPNQFNDPFDCNEKLIQFNTWNDVEILWSDLFEKIKEYYSDEKQACIDSSRTFKTLIYRKLGLFSMTDSKDNYQMWSYYAHNTGFCVEFDVKEFNFRHFGPFPINYLDNIISPVNISEVGGLLAMLIQSNIKNKWWKPENEWRLYIPNPNGQDMKSFGQGEEKFNMPNDHDRKFKYPLSSIKSITLGPLFFKDTICIKVSSDEVEFIFSDENNQLQVETLNFLSQIQSFSNISLFLAELGDFMHYKFIPIHILKLKENQYRVLTTSSSIFNK